MCEVTKCEVTKLSCNVEQSVNNDEHSNTYGEGVPFERLRRITGYISGDYVKSFNDAKKKEVEDRIASNTYNNVEHYHKRIVNDTKRRT